MRKFLVTVVFMLGVAALSLSQENVIDGLVLDAETGSPIEGVQITNISTNEGAVTNKNGSFQIAVRNNQSVHLILKHISFDSLEIETDPLQNKEFTT
jgi:hypothetical protein